MLHLCSIYGLPQQVLAVCAVSAYPRYYHEFGPWVKILHAHPELPGDNVSTCTVAQCALQPAHLASCCP